MKEGRTSVLLHGLLGFFKNLFLDFKVAKAELEQENAFEEWRTFIKDLMKTLLNVSDLCSNLLSNNGIIEDANLEVDCRGHPIL